MFGTICLVIYTVFKGNQRQLSIEQLAELLRLNTTVKIGQAREWCVIR